MVKVIIVGVGGHGRVVIDAALSNSQLEIIGFLDDSEVEVALGVTKLGEISDIEKFKGYKFHIAVGNNRVRRKLSEKIGVENLITIIHPNSYIARDSKIGKGCYIGANSVINSRSKVGNSVIVNTGTIIEHDCILEDYSHLSYRSLLGSGVTVKEEIYIEMGKIVKRGEIVERDIR